MGAALAAAAALFAVCDWAAVAAGRRRLELMAKPATLAALTGAATLIDPADATVRAWFVVGLGFSLAGDVFLLWADRAFVAGLGSFLGAHACYIVGFWVGGVDPAMVAAGTGVVAAALVVLAPRLLAGVARAMLVPVAAYMAVISVMVASAFGSRSLAAITGSLLFYASDALIAWNRFVAPASWHRIAIIITYHLGQAGLVISLL